MLFLFLLLGGELRFAKVMDFMQGEKSSICN